MCNLLEKYRPRHLSELLGQPWASQQLQLFAANPYPAAFLFEGDTGTGKTSAALLLAEALGVEIDQGPFGGLHQIASGEQTGETVRRTMESLRCRPFFGSGWKVLVVNEADAMTPNAAFVWLDALEDLPPQTVIIFTTNAAGRIPARLRDRCERLAFESSALLLRPYLQALIERIWREERCAGQCPEVEALGVADENGNASFRRLVQKLTPHIRAGTAPAAPKPVAEPEDRLHVYGRRWAGGERITQLAKEAGTSWNRLWSELTVLGYMKGA
jgi:replication-associated recombination protein RarA